MPRTASQLLWGLPLATMAAGLLVALWPASEPAPPTPTGASPAVVAPRPATTVPPPPMRSFVNVRATRCST